VLSHGPIDSRTSADSGRPLQTQNQAGFRRKPSSSDLRYGPYTTPRPTTAAKFLTTSSSVIFKERRATPPDCVIDPSPSKSPAAHAISSGVGIRTSVRSVRRNVQMATLARSCGNASSYPSRSPLPCSARSGCWRSPAPRGGSARTTPRRWSCRRLGRLISSSDDPRVTLPKAADRVYAEFADRERVPARIDGVRIQSAEDLVRIVTSRLLPGKVASFSVVRGAKRMTVALRLAERPATPDAALSEVKIAPRWG
jgi:hypothetical protein